ncbi:hypothetical protein [Snodgrassella alvi]|uniref:hypothetical protein n=1 Tax=Snodgrassella alvi TaxID=1196083 RepID=UPI00274128F8|nr:hypothetical protein [Snodgrassella alvi]WLT02932.1 hypothetical protein RAM00_03675 [Snodgrassella alvi]
MTKKIRCEVPFGCIEKNLKHKVIGQIQSTNKEGEILETYEMVSIWPLFQMGIKAQNGNIYYLSWDDLASIAEMAGVSD